MKNSTDDETIGVYKN